MSSLLYRIFIFLYPLAARFLSLFNKKAALWIDGRKDILPRLQHTIRTDKQIIWMHCSSLGEFEQGRPVIEQLKNSYPNYRVLITFFSPSGYEVRKDYEGADYVFYLPMDSPQNAKAFYDIVQPALVVYVKYEYWFYYLAEAKKRQIPLLLVSAVFRKSQPFFSGYGRFHRAMLACFTHIFVQDAVSVSLLRSIGFSGNVSLSGDTRFDRVTAIAAEAQSIEAISHFCGDSKVIVAGSTWTEDDKELDHFANTSTDLKFIIAPHNIGKDRITECLHLYKHSLLFSAFCKGEMATGKNTLIIDNIGMLSSLYRYATVCYVGGGFGADGVHNVLEAAVYAKPVVLGPVYEKYVEVTELIDANGAITVNTALQLEDTFTKLLNNDEYLQNTGKAAGEYVYSKQGATNAVMQFIYEKRLLTT